jgi:hypothetical protein
MRVSVPVCPQLKTRSEVATINFIRIETEIIVSQFIAFDARQSEPVGPRMDFNGADAGCAIEEEITENILGRKEGSITPNGIVPSSA